MTATRTATFTAFAFLIFFLLFFAITPAKADTITFASTGTAQSNSKGATVAVTPDAAWLSALPGSSWVSFAATGNPSGGGFVAVPNGTVVNFFDTFNIPGTPTSGSITVMADDSAAVLLNGVLLMGEASAAGNTYATCSNSGIGCLSPITINLPLTALKTGANTLEFDVAQRNGYSFGLDYLGSVIDPVIASEPAAGLMVGLGLLALSAIALRRRRLNA